MQLRNVTFAWERRGRGVLKNKKRVILDDVSARFPAGEISTILGPSGAGKVCLLSFVDCVGRLTPAVYLVAAPGWAQATDVSALWVLPYR